MNLLELQVLAVVSRIPDGSDAASLEFMFDSVTARPEAADGGTGAASVQSVDDVVGEPQV